MNKLIDLNKLDVIIILLIIVIVLLLLQKLSNVIVGRMTGDTELRLVNLFLDKGNYEKALKLCNKQLVKTPKNNDFLWTQGRILHKLNRMEEAKQVFIQIARDEPLLEEDANIYIKSINGITS